MSMKITIVCQSVHLYEITVFLWFTMSILLMSQVYTSFV